MNFNTAVLHAGNKEIEKHGSTLTPIYQTSAFEQKSADGLAKIFENRAPGYCYTRVANPTVTAFEDVDRIIAHARAQLPNEACGLIAGAEEGDERRIQKVYYLTNIDASNEHFTMDPREQLQAVKDMREKGWKPLGNWHSHPESPSRPSEEDKRLAYDSKASYLILSLMGEEPVLNSFHVEGGQASKEVLEIKETQRSPYEDSSAEPI